MKRKALTLAILTSILLNGCFAVGGLIAGKTASIFYDKRSIQTQLSDHKITQTAAHDIAKNKTLSKNTNISIYTYDGNVLLTGQAQTPALSKEVVDIVTNIKDVTNIYNQIEIAAPSDTLQSSNDTWLSTKVRTQLLSKKGLTSLSIKFITVNSVVYLMGKCTRSQGDEIADVVRRVQGVNKVIKAFEYTDTAR